MSRAISGKKGLTDAHLNNTMQIMVFQLNDKTYYGINISKIKSIEDYRKYKLVKNSINNDGNREIIEGFIQYQGEIIPFLNIEKWLGMYREEHKYVVTIVAEFNRKTISFPIYEIENIYNISIENLQTSSVNKSFVTYSTIISVNGEDVTCLILDVEQLLVDTFGVDDELERDRGANFGLDREILFAEDSKSARFIIEEIMKKTDLKYKIFVDGEEIVRYLFELSDKDLDRVGIVVTDLEMPKLDGYQVISTIKSSDRLKYIPIIVNSSMSNSGVKRKVDSLGAVGFIAKTDADELLAQIDKNILR